MNIYIQPRKVAEINMALKLPHLWCSTQSIIQEISPNLPLRVRSHFHLAAMAIASIQDQQTQA